MDVYCGSSVRSDGVVRAVPAASTPRGKVLEGGKWRRQEKRHGRVAPYNSPRQSRPCTEIRIGQRRRRQTRNHLRRMTISLGGTASEVADASSRHACEPGALGMRVRSPEAAKGFPIHLGGFASHVARPVRATRMWIRTVACRRIANVTRWRSRHTTLPPAFFTVMWASVCWGWRLEDRLLTGHSELTIRVRTALAPASTSLDCRRRPAVVPGCLCGLAGWRWEAVGGEATPHHIPL